MDAFGYKGLHWPKGASRFCCLHAGDFVLHRACVGHCYCCQPYHSRAGTPSPPAQGEMRQLRLLLKMLQHSWPRSGPGELFSWHQFETSSNRLSILSFFSLVGFFFYYLFFPLPVVGWPVGGKFLHLLQIMFKPGLMEAQSYCDILYRHLGRWLSFCSINVSTAGATSVTFWIAIWYHHDCTTKYFLAVVLVWGFTFCYSYVKS